jgi:uncharacterized membrane protein YbhN (UPF0104 family)
VRTTKSRWNLAEAIATIDIPSSYRREPTLAPAREQRWSIRRSLFVIMLASAFGWSLIFTVLYVLLP